MQHLCQPICVVDLLLTCCRLLVVTGSSNEILRVTYQPSAQVAGPADIHCCLLCQGVQAVPECLTQLTPASPSRCAEPSSSASDATQSKEESQGQQRLHGHLFWNLTRPSPKSSLLSIFLRSTLPVCSSTSRTLDWPLRPAETAHSTLLEHEAYSTPTFAEAAGSSWVFWRPRSPACYRSPSHGDGRRNAA